MPVKSKLHPAGGGLRRVEARAALVILVLALGACAPYLAPPGPGGATPGLTQEPVQTPARNPAGYRLTTADGLALPMRAWLPEENPPRAVILALHGFNDYSRAFEEPGKFWAARGIATYAYDQRGFGEAPNRGLWAGAPAMIGDLRAAVTALKHRHPESPVYVLGESMGGAVALAAAAGADPPPVSGVILAAPAVWARATMPLHQRVALWIGAHTLPWLPVSGRGLRIQASDNIEMLRALGRDPLVIKETRIDAIHGLADLMDQALAAAPALELPALLLYGAKDEVIPRDPTFRLWQSLPAAGRRRQRRALYTDGWHMLLRDLQAEVVLGDIAHWMADRQAPLPSGAEARAAARLNGES